MISTNSERVEKIITHIKVGGSPAICGTYFTEEKIQEIHDILVERKKLIDKYFNNNIRVRMRIKTKLWDELEMK